MFLDTFPMLLFGPLAQSKWNMFELSALSRSPERKDGAGSAVGWFDANLRCGDESNFRILVSATSSRQTRTKPQHLPRRAWQAALRVRKSLRPKRLFTIYSSAMVSLNGKQKNAEIS